ncbi:hypothetical protein L208DRAFT_1355643 [Tricholoma matsutake]|nr:hypothetical protein L208DRAFT_1355643 [Tricholoma matsutake 945]
MVVCSFFLRGQCKFGDKCRNEHPPKRGFGSQSWTNSNNSNLPLPFTTDTMTSDLTPQSEKPIWPLSSYGAAKHEPTLLKDLDGSPEELRVRAAAASQAGHINEYITYESNQISAAEQVYSNARANIKEAFEQAVKQSSLSALFDAQSMNTNTTNTSNPFGSGTSASTLSTPTASAFGNTTTTSAFGQTAFGRSAFGQPQPAQPIFGQSTTTTAPSAFGQQQPTQPPTAFGQPTQPVSAFVQPQQSSVFGQSSQPQSSLIKPATGAFGGLTGSGTTNAFGGGGFSAFSGQPSAFGAGATSTPASQANPGGSIFGQSAFSATPAAAPSQTPSVFGAPATTSAFGAPSVFGALAPQPVSAFGGSAFGTQAQTQPVSAFNTQNNPTSNPSNTISSAFANPPASASAFGGSSSLEVPKVASAFSAQPLSAFPMSSPSTSLSSFPAANRNNDKGKSVAGPPDFVNAKSSYQPGATPYDEQLPPNYTTAVLPQSVLETFKGQKFEWGKVPEWIPPLELR